VASRDFGASSRETLATSCGWDAGSLCARCVRVFLPRGTVDVGSCITGEGRTEYGDRYIHMLIYRLTLLKRVASGVSLFKKGMATLTQHMPGGGHELIEVNSRQYKTYKGKNTSRDADRLTSKRCQRQDIYPNWTDISN
jgi:hypothetical protein